MTLQEKLDKGKYGVELVEVFQEFKDFVNKTPAKNFRKEIITHSNLKKYLNKSKTNSKKIYIEKLILPRILAFCKKENIDFDSASDNGEEIFVPHSDSHFCFYLALKLMVCRVNLITRILNWNEKEYHKKENRDARIASSKLNSTDAIKREEEQPFILQVEHPIDEMLDSTIDITDDVRLRKIREWVDIKKIDKTKNQPRQSKIKTQLKDAESSISSTKVKPTKTNKLKYKTFDKLFENADVMKFCVDALRNVKPPIINKDNYYLLGERQKGAVVAWADVIKSKGKIKKVNDENLAYILNANFKELNFSEDGRTLREPKTTSYNKYHSQFIALIS